MPCQYGQVWLYIIGHEVFTFGLLSKKYNISKSTAKAIVDWGLKVLKKHHIEFDYKSSPIGCQFSYTTKAKVSNDIVIQVIEYLNQKANKKFNAKGKDAEKNILARIKEGYKLEDFKKVIDNKVIKWGGTNMDDYLRPITLFGNKFNAYLNENGQTTSKSQIQRTIETATNIATSVDWGFDSE